MPLIPRKWWLRDLVLLVLYVAVLYVMWVGLEYASAYYPGVRYPIRILILIGINITLAVSLNIINGHAGQFSLGHAGFMAIGAYTSAFLTTKYFGVFVEKLPEGSAQQIVWQSVLFLVSIGAGALVSAIAGYLVGLPSLRLRGDYLAIVTLGFGEIIRVLILNIEEIGAARGLTGIPPYGNFFWVFFFAGVTILISHRLIMSSVGRAFLAVREDEIAAEAMGVDTTRYKVKAFVIGSALAGVSGALYGSFLMYLNPGMFTFVKSFEVVAMVVLGGLGSITGSVLAAVILTILPEGLRFVKDLIPAGAPEILKRDPRMVIYSIMLIVLMLTRPQGLFGRREIWEFLPKRKDSNRKEGRDQDANDQLDRNAGPPVT
ncbi:MAG: branched-chain amino acid ABC transporter permease [Acidobacteriota bacterium]